MRWRKNQFGSRKVVGQATMLIACPLDTKSGGGNCPPSLTGSTTSGLKFVWPSFGSYGTFHINNYVAL